MNRSAGRATAQGATAQGSTAQGAGARRSVARGANLRRADGGVVRVLVVDDEPTLAEVLASVLRYEGWDVRTAGDGGAAVRTAREFKPDAVILDIMLPDFDGEEVLARLRGLLRRADVARSASDSLLVVGDLSMDEDAREVQRDGDLIELTATEFELLRYLMRNPRRVLSKAQILDRVWNYDFGGQAHVVELYISYLRKKIDAGREPMIQTVRGVGYVLKPVSE